MDIRARAVSQLAQDVYVNFVKTGNPNSRGLPQWPATNAGTGAPILFLGIKPRVKDDPYRQRYLFHN